MALYPRKENSFYYGLCHSQLHSSEFLWDFRQTYPTAYFCLSPSRDTVTVQYAENDMLILRLRTSTCQKLKTFKDTDISFPLIYNMTLQFLMRKSSSSIQMDTSHFPPTIKTPGLLCEYSFTSTLSMHLGQRDYKKYKYRIRSCKLMIPATLSRSS